MKKSGIFGLIGAGAALAGVGLFKLLSKSKDVEEADVFVGDEEVEVEVDDYEVEED